MKILFVYPNILRYPSIPIGIASLVATLRKDGHECSLFDATFINDDELIHKFIESVEYSKCDILAVHCTSSDWKLVQILLESLRKNSLKKFTIIGGHHPTAAFEDVILSPFIDVCIIGEGELVVKELLYKLENREDISHVENCWIKVGEKIYKNKLRPLIQNLDSLPFPAWEIFDKRHMIRYHTADKWSKIIGIETSRGCPYSCTYCMNSYVRNIYKGLEGKFCREKSVERILTESQIAKDTLGVDYIRFVDDNFIGSMDRLEELSNRFPEHVGLPVSIMASADKINERTIKLLSKMGADSIGIGVETGNEMYRKNVLNKHVTNEQIIRAFKLSREYGIETMAFYMIGLPMEKKQFVEQTIEFNNLARPTNSFVSTFFPFPGTRLYSAVLKKGLVEKYDFLPDFYHGSILKFDDILPEDFDILRRQFSNVILDTGPFDRRDLRTVTMTR